MIYTNGDRSDRLYDNMRNKTLFMLVTLTEVWKRTGLCPTKVSMETQVNGVKQHNTRTSAA